MKYLIILTFCFASLKSYCQDTNTWKATYYLAIPEGWTTERFPIPISFAPEIRYRGVEDLRFTPGWAKNKSEEYWTYAFLWCLDTLPEINYQIISSNLRAYYTGLFNVNTDSVKRSTIKGKIVPISTDLKKIKTDPGDLETYSGTIKMTDYMQLKPLTLNCIVHIKSCPNSSKAYLFYELSPQPFSHHVWLSLNKLWADFKCSP